jgi:hypothetical protein
MDNWQLTRAGVVHPNCKGNMEILRYKTFSTPLGFFIALIMREL